MFVFEIVFRSAQTVFGFEHRCTRAAVAQLVEHVHGKHEVLGSIPSRSSVFLCVAGILVN